MADNNNQQQHYEPKQILPAISYDFIIPKKVSNDAIKTGKEANTSNQNNGVEGKCPQPLVVKVHKSKWLSNQEVISLVGLFVSLAAFVLATCSFNKTSESVKNAQIATAKRDSLDSIQRITNHYKDSITIKLAEQSLQTQINAVKENQTEFKKINEPYLEIEDVKINSIQPNEPLNFQIVIANLKSNPVKIIDSRMGTINRVTPPPMIKFDKDVTQKNAIGINMYIIKEAALSLPITGLENLDERTIQLLYDGNYNVYFTGKIKYQDLIEKTFRTYTFQLKIKPRRNKDPWFEYIVNDNK